MKKIVNNIFWSAFCIFLLFAALFLGEIIIYKLSLDKTGAPQLFDRLFGYFITLCICTLVLQISNFILCRLKT